MPKLPWMQFNTGDWLKDPKLSMCLPSTRGIWIDAIAAMHEDGRVGTLSGTADQLIRILRCSETALMAALSDLQSTGAGDVTQRNGVITLINRRMQREYKERELNRLRQERFREKEECNGKNNGSVTPMSLLNSISDSLFDLFYKEYPRKENKKKAREEFIKANITEGMLPGILDWIVKAKESEQWQDKDYIPHPSTWIHQRRWESDPPPPVKQKKPKKQADTSFLALFEETNEPSV